MAVENPEFFVEMYEHLKDVGDWGFLGMWKYEVRMANGETTGDKLIDYLFFDSGSTEHLHKRAKEITDNLERIRSHVGEEMIVVYQGTGFTGHTWPGTFHGEYRYTKHYYTVIESADVELKMEKRGLPVFIEGKGYTSSGKDDLAKAALLLPVRGYSKAGGRIISDSPPFIEGSMNFPEYTHRLLIGKEEVSEWASNNASYYEELKGKYEKGISQLEVSVVV